SPYTPLSGSRALRAAGVRLEAVLDRIRLPLAAVAALRPGALLPVAAGALSRIRIEGRGRRLVASGRLGQCQGHLAVRIAVLEPDGDTAAGQGAWPAARDPAGTGRPATMDAG